MRHVPWILTVLLTPGLLLAQEGDIESILKDLTPYQKIVEDLRGEKFEKDVPGSVQSKEDFASFIDSSIDKELPPEWVAGWEKSLKKLQLLPEDFEFEEGLRSFLLTQAGAYYDTEQEAFFVVATDLDKKTLETVVVHELQHALQDQLFDLDAMTENAQETRNNDRESVISFIAEGEATFIMTLHEFSQMGMDPEMIMGPMLETSLDMMRRLSPDQLREMQAMSGQEHGGEMEKAMDALEEMPSFIVSMFLDPYMEGAYAVYKVYEARKWEGVSELFRNPPASTEMMLHPEKLLEGKDLPVDVELPDVAAALGKGWKRAFDDTMGEHGTRCMLEAHFSSEESEGEGGDQEDLMKLLQGLSGGKASPSEKAAAGWGGDRYALYEHETGATALTWGLVFDTEEDAKEFLETFQDAVERGFPYAMARDAEEGSFHMITGSDAQTETVVARLRSQTVHVVIAPPYVRVKKALTRLGGAVEGLPR